MINLFEEENGKNYEIRQNREFLKWLLPSIESGNKVDIDVCERLTDSTKAWYEFKYPANEDTSEYLTSSQFLMSLDEEEYNIMNCKYGKETTDCHYVYKDGIRHKRVLSELTLKTVDEKKSYFVRFERESGKVVNSNFPHIVGLNLEDVLYILKKYHKNDIDYSIVSKTISKYYFDIELRHRLMQLSALKIFYSAKTPEIGYERANKFLDEFSEDFGFLLSYDEIDNIYDNKTKIR